MSKEIMASVGFNSKSNFAEQFKKRFRVPPSEYRKTETWRRLGLEDQASYTVVSGYEIGRLEPSLITLLRYARLAKVSVETLIDDEMKIKR